MVNTRIASETTANTILTNLSINLDLTESLLLPGPRIHHCKRVAEEEVGVNLHQERRQVELEALFEQLQQQDQEGRRAVNRQWQQLEPQSPVNAVGVDD